MGKELHYRDLYAGLSKRQLREERSSVKCNIRDAEAAIPYLSSLGNSEEADADIVHSWEEIARIDKLLKKKFYLK